MRNIKRASLSVRNQMKKTALILSVVTIVLTMLIIGMSIEKSVQKASNNAKAQMRAEMIIEKDFNKLKVNDVTKEKLPPLKKDIYEKIKKIKGVKEVSATLKTPIRTSLKQIDSREQNNMKFQFNDMQQSPTNYLYGLDAKEDDKNFASKNFELIAGEMPYISKLKHPIIVSQKYAEENSLKIGDAVSGFGGEKTGAHQINYMVSGMYKIKNVKPNQMMLYDSMSNPENNFYTTTSNVEVTAQLDNPDEAMDYNKIQVKVDKVDELKNVIARIKKEVPNEWKYFSFRSDFDQYSRVTSAINNVARISTIIVWTTIFAGVIVLGLVMIISLRNRNFEFGVLQSIGESKLGIITQMLAEILLVFIVSFGLAISFSSFSANSIADSMLSQAVIKTNNVDDHLPRNNNKLNTVQDEYETKKLDKVEKVNVNIFDSRVLRVSFGVGGFIILISSLLPLLLVLKKDPKEIMLDK